MTPIFGDAPAPSQGGPVINGGPSPSMLGLMGAIGGRPQTPMLDPSKMMDLAKMFKSAPGGNGQQIPADQYELGKIGQILSQKPLSQSMGWFQPSAMNALPNGPGIGAAPSSALMTPTGFTGG